MSAFLLLHRCRRLFGKEDLSMIFLFYFTDIKRRPIPVSFLLLKGTELMRESHGKTHLGAYCYTPLS